MSSGSPMGGRLPCTKPEIFFAVLHVVTFICLVSIGTHLYSNAPPATTTAAGGGSAVLPYPPPPAAPARCVKYF